MRPGCILVLSLAVVSCAAVRKLEALKRGEFLPSLSMASDVRPEKIEYRSAVREDLRVRDAQGREMLLMDAVRDENGEMVAVEEIKPVVVCATFKNVPERNGKVDLRFDVRVPSQMTDSRWQLRLSPVLYIGDESAELEDIYITGGTFRDRQLKGYDRYGRYLDGISDDPSDFLFGRDLEIFLERNDGGGVSETEARNHYTDRFRMRINHYRTSRKEEVFQRLVRSPIVSEGLRLDTVIAAVGGDIVYRYVQTFSVRPGLRRAQITLHGNAYEIGKELCSFTSPDTLTFYISSLSTLVDRRERYVTQIVERRVEANSVCWIEFAPGSSEVDISRGYNSTETDRIRRNLRSLLEEGEYEMDSIVVTSSCSPEGSFSFNRNLSRERSRAVCDYFAADFAAVRFLPASVPENWGYLSLLVERDDSLNAADKKRYFQICRTPDPDRREARLSSEKYYRYLRERLYPRLRTVRFDFHLHRTGMVKDTVHTTQIDSVYMRGVKAIEERDYRTAIEILRPYADWNTALAYCALDYNASALSVLEKLPSGAREDYMKAVLYSRRREDGKAVEFFRSACEKDGSFIHRGNLDPEIYRLIDKYDRK